MIPQPDKFTYSTQFFRLCLIFFTFYIPPCNDGVLRISRILKLRNQLVPHQRRGNNIRSNDPNSLEEISRKGFSTGVSHMYSSSFEVSQWCNAVDLLGKRKRITYISCFGEISGSRGMERNILYLISKYPYSTYSNPISGWRIPCRNDIMLIHVLHGQVNIVCQVVIPWSFGRETRDRPFLYLFDKGGRSVGCKNRVDALQGEGPFPNRQNCAWAVCDPIFWSMREDRLGSCSSSIKSTSTPVNEVQGLV